MIWGVVKRKQSIEVIGRKPYARVKWKAFADQAPDRVKPHLELTRVGLYQVYRLDDYLFHERSFEKNDHEYRISFE